MHAFEFEVRDRCADAQPAAEILDANDLRFALQKQRAAGRIVEADREAERASRRAEARLERHPRTRRQDPRSQVGNSCSGGGRKHPPLSSQHRGGIAAGRSNHEGRSNHRVPGTAISERAQPRRPRDEARIQASFPILGEKNYAAFIALSTVALNGPKGLSSYLAPSFARAPLSESYP